MKSLVYLILMVPVIVSCSSQGGRWVREPAGAELPNSHVDFLTVYSATETVPTGDLTYSYPHTAYTIYRDDIIYRMIPNHVGMMDEVPMKVALPTGAYVIRAEDEAYGRVRVPVTAEGGQRITLNLERGWSPPANVSPDKLIRLEDGRVVGFVQ